MMAWFIIACAALLVAMPVSAQTWTIATAGSYLLTADRTSTSGFSSISIEASNVTLDLGGHTVRCQPSNPGTAVTFGVKASDIGYITIKNGAITGCMFGIHAGYSHHVTLQDVDLTGNTYIGANLGGSAGDNIVRHCTFASITGYTAEAYAIGLNGIGPRGIIEDSLFQNLYRQPNASTVGEGVGILVEANATGVVVRRNTIQNALLQTHTIGIWAAGGATVAITDNILVNVESGAEGDSVTATGNALTLTAPLASSVAFSVNSGTASGNTITGYAVPFVGSIVDGGNTINGGTPIPPPTGIWYQLCLGTPTNCITGTLPPGGA